jgi:hypothetical protein
MTLLTREAIKQKSTFEIVEVDVSELGSINPETGERERTTVFVREMSARQRDGYEATLFSKKGKTMEPNLKDIRAKLAVATCCDADGNLIFCPEDVEYLSQQSVKALDRICEAARKLNGLNDDGVDEEELVKN